MSKKGKEVKKIKRKFGDRKDGRLIRDLDAMHIVLPYIYPRRCDNEAFITEQIDLTNINKYLEEINKDEKEFKYTIFHLISAALVKIVAQRPQLNRFVQNGRTYQRNELSLGFVIKKQFKDSASEGLAFMRFDGTNTVKDLHERFKKEITSTRSGKEDASTEGLKFVSNLPRFIVRWATQFLNFLDKYGKMPKSLADVDMNYVSVFISNLGSIKLNSAYHHLTNRGTNSLFVVIGAKKKVPFYDDEGNVTMRECLDIGMTVDERIADGYYFSKSIRLLNKLLAEPELLELPALEEIDYE